MRLWLKLAGKQTCRVLRHWAWLDFFGRVDLVEPVGELGFSFCHDVLGSTLHTTRSTRTWS